MRRPVAHPWTTRRGRRARLRAASLGLVVVGALVTATVLAAMTLGEVVAVRVTSGSMSPAIDLGDIVIARPVHTPLTPGTVIVARRGDALVTHRVVSVTDGGYVTQGDASAEPDTAPVGAGEVLGVAVAVVPWLGRSAGTVGLALIATSVVVGALGTVRARRRAGTGAGPAHRRWRADVVPHLAGPAAAVAVVLLAWLPAPSTAVFTSTTDTSASFTAAPTFAMTYYLASDGIGNRVSSPVLPLDRWAPTASALPNYDTDRDAFPGLALQKGGAGAMPAESDPTKTQVWSTPSQEAHRLRGAATLTLYSTVKDTTRKAGHVWVYLRDCLAAACTTFALDDLSMTDWTGGVTGWSAHTFELGMVDRVLGDGHRLEVKVTVDADSGDTLWFAYGTVAEPSSLTIG